jgi:peptide/nickel transport system permease protein
VRYWLQKLGLAVLLLLAVSMLTFGAMNLLGDPLFNILGPVDPNDPDSAALVEAAEAQYHLDRPLPERYVRWLGDFVTGDFGVQFSSTGQPPVIDVVKERLPRSLTLMAMAQFTALAIAIPWGVWSGSRANSKSDKASTAVSFGLVSMPNFALAIVLLYVFGFKLDWLPDTYNASDPFLSRLHQLVLPALTLGLPAAAVYQRLLRTDLISTLQEDYILMARAKGVSRRRVLFGHALRPSLFSVVTVFGINAGALIGGSLVVEQVFRIQGIGDTIIKAVLREDFPVVLAVVMVIATGFVLLNLAVDLLYAVLDPRVRR